ncbi:MAG: response regulator transcription factor [Burkholderiaceae bacterium]|nr:MAG: response regulator transcription factor [Burkholderiaceae bacterium]
MRIAILDDDKTQLALVSTCLISAGHHCHTFTQGKELLHHLRRESFDLLVLDWQVPDLSGLEVLEWVRKNVAVAVPVPVLFMTGRASESDIVDALAAGADDYMVKPIRRAELVARVNALLRRAYPNLQPAEVLRFKQHTFDPHTCEATLDGHPVEMTRKEFDLAVLLFHNIGRALSRSHIMEAVWGRDPNVPSRSMDTHISRVRSKLDLRPNRGYRLSPVYSYGYRLEQFDPMGEPDNKTVISQIESNAAADA